VVSYLFSSFPMYRNTILVYLAGFALSAFPVDFRTPLRHVGNNDLVVNLTVSNSAGSAQIEAVLTSAELTIIATNATESGRARLSFHHVERPARSIWIDVFSPMYFSRPATSYLGMGALSALTQRTGSCAVIKGDGGAELVLGSTLEYFSSQCVPRSLFTLDRLSNNTVTPKLTLGGREIEFDTREARIVSGRRLFSVPVAMYERLEELVAVSGGCSRVPGHLSQGLFTDCVSDVHQHLPNITLSFALGSLLYFPEDYFEFNSTDNTFQLLIDRSPTERFLMFNPLTIANANVRVNEEDDWNICDSAATF